MSTADTTEGTTGAAYAGFSRRAGAAAIDLITLFIPWCWTFLLTIAIIALGPWKSHFDGGTIKLAAFLVATLLTPLLYFSLLECSKWQATIGKLMFRLRVTDVQGRRLTFRRAISRNLAKWLSTLSFGIGYFICGFTRRKRALHDLLAGSVVLRFPRS